MAHKLAAHLDLPHLDTGLTYRAVAHTLLQNGQSLDNEAVAISAAEKIDLGSLDRIILSDHTIGDAASKIAIMSGVRETLVKQQRMFANTPPGAVLDGRDIGTVVCRDAFVKLYVTASAETRARRRWNEILSRDQDADFNSVLEDIRKRDERDTGRTDSPLKPAKDAHLLDTSQMSIEAAFTEALRIIDLARAS